MQDKAFLKSIMHRSLCQFLIARLSFIYFHYLLREFSILLSLILWLKKGDLKISSKNRYSSKKVIFMDCKEEK